MGNKTATDRWLFGLANRSNTEARLLKIAACIFMAGMLVGGCLVQVV